MGSRAVWRRTAFTVCAFAGIVLVQGRAEAHPHVFADAKAEIAGAPDGTLLAVRNIWRMDELFSATVLAEFDANRNGTLDPGELDKVGETVKASIAEWNFYTEVKLGDRPVRLKDPDKIRALWDDGRLLLFFEMRPVDRIDLARKTLTFANFDETFYTAFDFASADDLDLVDMPRGCAKTLITPDPDETAKLFVKSVASLSADEKIPDDGIDYAEILAQRLEVTCAPAT